MIELNNERLTKKQVCTLLHCGYSTLGRMMREGKIKFTKVAAKHFESSVFFRREDLAEFMPVTEPVDKSAGPGSEDSPGCPAAPASGTSGTSAPAPTPAPESRPESRDIRTWAEKHRENEVPDSCGNYLDGSNLYFPSTGASLIGPCIPKGN